MLIFLSGKSGSGKTTIMSYFRNKYGFIPIHLRSFLSNIAKNLGKTRNEYYRNLIHSDPLLPIKIVAKKIKLLSPDKNYVFEGIISDQELNIIKSNFPEAYFFYVDAEQKVRIERVSSRNKLKDSDAERDVLRSDSFRLEAGIEQVPVLVDQLINNNGTPFDKKKIDLDIKKGVRRRLLGVMKNRFKPR